MSPYLFMIYMEKLAILMQEKVDYGDWQLVKISINGLSISQLFFADDCILFVKASSKQVWLVKEVLNLFYKVSSFEVNVSKSVYKVSIISLE